MTKNEIKGGFFHELIPPAKFGGKTYSRIQFGSNDGNLNRIVVYGKPDGGGSVMRFVLNPNRFKS